MNKFYTLLTTGLAFVTLGTFADEKRKTSLLDPWEEELQKTTIRMPDTGRYEVKKHQGMIFCSPRISPSSPRSGTGEAEATLRYEYGNGITPLGISIYNKETGMIHSDYDGKNNSFVRKLPKGTYDMFASYMSRYSELYYVFRENVEIVSDTTIVLPQVEATNPFSIRTVDQNGKKLYMPIYDTNYQVIDPGTADDFSSLSFFFLEGFGNVAAVIGGGYKYKGHETDFFISPVSNRYWLAEARVVSVGEIYYFNKFVVNDFSTREVTNNPGDFIAYNQTFRVSPKWEDDTEAHVPGYYMAAVYNGDAIIGQRSYIPKMPTQDFTTKFYIDSPKDDNPSGHFNLLIKPLLSDYRKSEEYQPGNMTYDYYFINGPQVLGDKNGLYFVNAGYGVDGGFNAPEGSVRSRLYPGHPGFSFTDGVRNAIYGNNCPVNSFQYMSYKDENGTRNSYYTSNYVGRYGELREADNFNLSENIRYNEDGTYELTVTNENIVVEGLQGRNVTRVVMYEEKEDHVAPTLQMLQFKDNDGRLSDRFDSMSPGVMEFSGGDFDYVYLPEAWSGWFTCGKLEVEAFTSPYGKEEWAPLAVEEVPEMFFMPGFGYFYRSSLKNVAQNSENAWYDVKFKLTDPSGNAQIQTISPAFRIEARTSVTAENMTDPVLELKEGMLRVANDAGNSIICLYTVEGKIIAESHSGRLSVSSIPSGIYLAKVILSRGNVRILKVSINK